ncbi:MAG: cohesin domain-containing protein [Pyrinomonadaceae bacterium]
MSLLNRVLVQVHKCIRSFSTGKPGRLSLKRYAGVRTALVLVIFSAMLIIAMTSGAQDQIPNKEEQDKANANKKARVFYLPDGKGTQSEPISRQADAFGITPPIRDLPEFNVSPIFEGEPFIRPGNNKVQIERALPGWDKPTDDPSAALSRSFAESDAPQAMPAPSLTFNGVLSNDLLTAFGTTSMPPDTVGDVGPNHYVQSTNIGVFRIFNKAGTALNVNTRISTLFSSLPANNKCRTTDNGDPVILYDPLADRWLITQFALTGASGENFAPSYECIAVSVTGDPTGAYFAYGFRSPNDNFLDYPHLGVWTNGYYMATHQFNSAATAYVAGGFWAFNRDKMLVGDPTANVIYISNTAVFGHMPADIDGNVAPPAGVPAMFFSNSADEFGGADSVLSYEFVPDYNVPANSTLTAKPAVATTAFDPRDPAGRNDIEQPAPATAAQNVDTISSRLMQRVGYRNLGTIAAPAHSYVMNWTVNVSGVNPTTAGTHQAGVRWTEMRRSGGGVMSIFDQGTHAPDAVSGTGRNRWMGSIAQDYLGNLAIGFSRSGPGAAQFPDIVWAGRTGGQVAAGTMNEGEATMFASTGVQQATNGRWGDYSAMSGDPSDDCSFWYTQQWRDSANNGTGTNNPFKWSTRIGTFKFPSCTSAPKGTIAATVTECSTGNPVSGANVSVSPGGIFRKTKADGTLVSNIDIAPDTYSVTALLGGVSATNGSVTVTNGNTNNVNLCLAGPLMTPNTAAITAESCAVNSAIDPGETMTVSLGVTNSIGATTANLTGTLQTTGGVTLPSSPQNYGAVVAGATVSRNFTFTADPALRCGNTVVLTLALTDGVTNLGNVVYTIPGVIAAGAQTAVSYTAPVVPIADNSTVGSTATLNVSGFSGNIADLDFRFDGTANTSTAALAGVDHTWVGDLIINLTSPSGTNVTLLGSMNSNAGANGQCNNDHLSQIILDDQTANGFINVACVNTTTTSVIAAGTRKPDSFLSIFNGENPNGTWTLKAFDTAASDTGNIRAFSLLISPVTCTACGAPTATATATSTNTPASTPTNTATATATNTFTPTATNTSTPTATNTFTPTATATNTFTPTATNTSTPTATNTFTPTATATNTFTPTATATNTFTPTSTATNTFTPTATATNTFTPTATATNTFTPTATATNTFTPTATATNTFTPTATATNTFTPTATETFTPTPTATNTFTPTATSTETFTPTATATETFTPTATATETFTPTATATETFTPTATATETFTPTNTATDTPTSTPTAPAVISGTITYGNAIGSPATRFVPNVAVDGAGSPPVSDVTTSSGTYSLTGFGSGSYTVTPSKTGGQNASITSFDAARVGQHVVGATVLNATQLTVGDTSGNGGLSSFDAAQIARYAVSLPNSGSSGNWIFVPVSRTYSSVTSSISGEDYSALLMGEVSGNWQNTGRIANNNGPEKASAINIPQMSTTAGAEISIPVNIDGVANKGIISYEFDLRYDPLILQPTVEPVDLAGTVSRGLSVVTNVTEPGLLRVVIYGPMPLDEDGVLLNLRFTAVGTSGSISPLTFERIIFNEGEPRLTFTEGMIRIE